MLFVNFKTYKEGTGENAIKLASIIRKVSESGGIKIIPVVQAADIREVSEKTNLEVWAQHVDSEEYGAHTGAILSKAVCEDGAKGTFLNHSEQKFRDNKSLRMAHKRAREVGLKTLVFAADISELKKVLTLHPTYIAYEPPELVGSRTTSVSKARPRVIKKASVLTKKVGVPLIVGAGIKSAEDVRTSLKFGAVGVVVASDIVKAKSPKVELMDLVEGFK